MKFVTICVFAVVAVHAGGCAGGDEKSAMTTEEDVSSASTTGGKNAMAASTGGEDASRDMTDRMDADTQEVVDSGNQQDAQVTDAQVDATIEDAGADAMPPGLICDDGEMPCDGSCVTAVEPTLDSIESRIFSKSCALSASCHTGISPKEGLDLTTADSAFAYVDQPATQMPSAKIFDTAAPADSYLLRKLRGTNIASMSSTGSATTQMPPPPTAPLCEEKIAVIEEWIAAGAER